MYVYLIRAGTLYKIGKSNDPNKRMRTFQTANPTRLEMVATISSNDAYGLESRLHRKYHRKRMSGGEWFRLDQDDVQYIKSLRTYRARSHTSSSSLYNDFKIIFLVLAACAVVAMVLAAAIDVSYDSRAAPVKVYAVKKKPSSSYTNALNNRATRVATSGHITGEIKRTPYPTPIPTSTGFAGWYEIDRVLSLGSCIVPRLSVVNVQEIEPKGYYKVTKRTGEECLAVVTEAVLDKDWNKITPKRAATLLQARHTPTP